MREKSRYQMNVSVVTESLRMRAGKDTPEGGGCQSMEEVL